MCSESHNREIDDLISVFVILVSLSHLLVIITDWNKAQVFAPQLPSMSFQQAPVHRLHIWEVLSVLVPIV